MSLLNFLCCGFNRLHPIQILLITAVTSAGGISFNGETAKLNGLSTTTPWMFFW